MGLIALMTHHGPVILSQEVAVPITMAHSPVQWGLSGKPPRGARRDATAGRKQGTWRCKHSSPIPCRPILLHSQTPRRPCLALHSLACAGEGSEAPGVVSWRRPSLAWSPSGQSGRDVGCHEEESCKSPLQDPTSLSLREISSSASSECCVRSLVFGRAFGHFGCYGHWPFISKLIKA